MSDSFEVDFLALQQALVGRYSLELEIGRGGMGIVYLAHEVALDRPVALKLLLPQLAAQPTLRERFLREARTAAKLSHPNVVQIYAVDEVDDFVFLVMAYVEGETLGERIRNKGPLSSKEAVTALREVAWALAYAHAEGVVHRDVKPDNILLEKGNGRALVTDFGIAHAGREPGVAGVAEVLGAAEFMSPEQANGDELDARSDLYALGVTGFYALTGRLRFEGTTASAPLAPHLTQPAPPVASIAPEVPAVVAQAIDRCLRKSPADRFADGAALAEAMGGTALKRETPVPLRIFNKKIRELATNVPAIFVIWYLTIGGVIGTAFAAPEFQVATLIAGALVILGTALEPLGVLGAQARRLLRAGFGIEDVRMALEQEVSRRNEEIHFEHGKEVTGLDHALRVVSWPSLLGGFGAFFVGFLVGSEVLVLSSVLSSMFGTVTAFAGAFRNKRRRDAVGQGWLTLLRTRVGKWLFKLSGVGLDREALASGGAHRPTEMAIGIAADRLYDELPRSVRRDLPGLPDTIRKLEADAQNMRRLVEEMGALLAEIGDDPTRVGADERTKLRADLEGTRDAGQKRMTNAVSALEKIRLGLLRIHAGAGSVESLTADLGSAQALSEDIEHLLAGRRSVEELLGTHARTSELPTPTPA